MTRGTSRRTRRRAYRAWCRYHNQGLDQGADSPEPPRLESTKATPKRSKWFQQTLHWQEGATRRKKPLKGEPKTTPPLSYNSKLRIGALNVQGMADTLKVKSLVQLMDTHRLGVIMLSETRSTSYYSYLSEQHLVVLSGNNRDKYAGVGAIIHPKLRPHLVDVVQVNTRILHLIFNKKGGRVHVIGCYAPHSGLDLDSIRQPFWDTLEEYVERIPQPEPVYVTGDFNVRFQAAHPKDKGVTGPYVYGKGKRYIDHTASSNRSLCVRTMQLLDMVEVASYKSPNPVHHITYKDKAAPPTDWSQFVLDPLILQQFYHQLTHTMPGDTLAVAANIRSFLSVPEPLPPTQKTPTLDPIRFQRLDHTFTRSQWLPSVNSCRSKLYAGFQSDHYLMVTEVQVKLAQRLKPTVPKPKLNLSTPTEEQKQSFNDALRSILDHTAPTGPRRKLSAHAPDTAQRTHITFYTDGSGSKGRCTASTPAGWGWCAPQGADWLEAYGPVVTSSDHTAYVGATVGSNNTGEVTAMVEALLFAVEHEYTHATVHTDSLWARNVILGKWKARTNKALVHTARRLFRRMGVTVHIEWIKAHAGHVGNEKADKLANLGRAAATSVGGRNLVLPPERPPSAPPQTTPLVSAMAQASKQAFQPYERKPRKPWVTDYTLQLLEQAKKAEAAQEDDAKHKRNVAKRSARKDRIKWIHDQLESDPAATRAAWHTAKNQKKGFVGARKHLVVDGKPQPWSKTHEAFRDHLQNKQWASPTIPDHTAAERRSREALYPTLGDEPLFTLTELTDAMAQLKKRKASGPDGIPNELWLLLDDHNANLLLDLYNHSWEHGTIPQEWAEAIVVSIYKGKGDDTDPSNYRPIALLNTVYKIYATMLQRRLAGNIESRLRPTQYGFRAGKGTRQPLFILRRAMEWSLMTTTPLYILSLDWRQAFDSLDHTAMLEALSRFGLSDKMIAAVAAIYEAPTFQTRGFQDHTAEGQVHAGIRQGCPLSPYLFVIVLTVIFADIDHDLDSKGMPRNTWSSIHPVYDLEYADDTLLLARTIPQMQSFLSSVEKIAAEYGMKLNDTKTELLTKTAGETTTLKFANGAAVPTTPQLKYLGSMIAWEHPFHAAFLHRAGLAESAYKKLRLVWNSRLPVKTKLRMFRSTFVAILTYGLDAITLTPKDLKRIDGFWFRFLRRIVGIKASFYSRVPNSEVYRKADSPEKPSTTLLYQQYKTTVQIFQSPQNDPMHSVVFTGALKDRILHQGRRRGMQFPYWIEVQTKLNFPECWNHTATPLTGPHWKYVLVQRKLRKSSFELAPKRARTERAGPP